MLIKKPFKKGMGPSIAPYYKAAGGSTPFGITFVGTNNSVVAGTSFTFTSQGIGTADATRVVAVGIAHGINALTVTSVTIGGNAATQATGAAVNSGAGASTDIWYLAVPSGTTADIVVNISASQTRCAIDVYRVVGTSGFSAGSNGFSTTGVLTLSATAAVPAGGGAIAILNVHASGAAGLITNGGNLTIDQNGVAFGNSTIGAGSNITASGSTAFTFNWTVANNDAAMSVATFAP